MSTTSIIVPKLRTIPIVLGTSTSDLYTVPANYKATITSIFISNTTASTLTFSLDWYVASTATTYNIAELVIIDPNSFIQVENAFYLAQNDKLKGLASAGSSVSVFITVDEAFYPVQF
jgi:hypothetical protein